MNVIITGASSGFGKAMAETFAKNGHNIWLTARRFNILQELKSELENKYQVEVNIDELDVRDKQKVTDWANKLKAQNKPLDLLINNAGLALGVGSIDIGDSNDWDTMIDTNVKGLLYVSKAIIPFFKQQKKGHIINIGSTAGKSVYAGGNIYCASKHAVDALSRAMRIDLLPYNIKVTSINPGMAETEFSIVRYKGDKEKAGKVYQNIQPLTAQDIADTAYYCATLPAHVCINDLTITCTQQADAHYKVFNK